MLKYIGILEFSIPIFIYPVGIVDTPIVVDVTIRVHIVHIVIVVDLRRAIFLHFTFGHSPPVGIEVDIVADIAAAEVAR